MKNARARKLVTIAVIVATVAGLALVGGYFFLRGRNRPVPVDPQAAAYEALIADSTIKPEMYFRNGFPRGVHVDVTVPGATPVERATSFLDTYIDLYMLADPAFALQVRRSYNEAGDHVVFYQTYKGVPVFASELVVMLKENHVNSVVGGMVTDPSLDVTPAIADTDAEAIARADRGLPADAPVIGLTELMVFDRSLFEDVPPELHLIWRVTFGSVPWQIFVDAHDGQIVHRIELTESGFDLDLEDGNGNTIQNSSCFNNTTDDDAAADEDGVFGDYQNDFDVNRGYADIQATYNFFLQSPYNLDSYDDDGEDILMYVHTGLVNNAQYVGEWWCDAFQFGEGVIDLDVTTHEFTHAIIWNTSELVYSGQSGALNESFADIMGVMADTANWTMGEGITCACPKPLRDLSNPPMFNQPDHNSEYTTSCVPSDNGCVHTNSGINNYAYYLISEGGVHPDNGVKVTGIGRARMGYLAFVVMRTLPANAQLEDSRNQSVWKAMDLGYSSFEICQIRNAFYAVGLGNPDIDCDGASEDPDQDGDGIPFEQDNCPSNFNPSQKDADKDGLGNVCDGDPDDDGVPNYAGFGGWRIDNCPNVYNPDQTDANYNGIGDACDPSADDDFDDDGILNDQDNCLLDANPDQVDTDQDGDGDACDPDGDADGWSNDNDNCPFTPNPDQKDSDNDGTGDACDPNPDCAGDVIAWTTGYPELGIDPKPVVDPNACLSTKGVTGLDPLGPDGKPNDIGVRPRPGGFVQIPLPDCFRTAGSNGRNFQQVLFTGMPEYIHPFVINQAGGNFDKPSRNGDAGEMRFTPLGGDKYFLLLYFDQDAARDLDPHFQLSILCEPADTLAPTSTPQPLATYTYTTDTAPTATATPLPSRCEIFKPETMSLVVLGAQADGLFRLYLLMPDGVPGLELAIPGDPNPWQYTAMLGNIPATECAYLGYSGRLYCDFNVPPAMYGTVQKLKVYVNGCDLPIYSNDRVSVTRAEPTPTPTAPACYPTLDSASCAAVGGTYGTDGKCKCP